MVVSSKHFDMWVWRPGEKAGLEIYINETSAYWWYLKIGTHGERAYTQKRRKSCSDLEALQHLEIL